MKGSLLKNKKALGLMEIVIAISLVVMAGIPILKLVFGSRNETTSAINYLRAMELADETLEWASITKFSELDNLTSFSGSIVVDGGSGFTTEEVHTSPVEYENWKSSGLFVDKPKYSEDYINAFFYRIIDVEDVKSDAIQKDMLKKVTVTIKWSEGKRPTNLSSDCPERNRQVQLSILVINDENLQF
jgi:hypothetical protein